MTTMTDMGGPRRRWTGRLVLVIFVSLCLAVAVTSDAQVAYLRGQNVAPSFEGWAPNPDGSFTIYFGYMNRNFEEHLHIPVGPNNFFKPDGPDRGQPTYVFPRRNRDVFTVIVPADFGDQELVWTITANGKTENTHASLLPGFIDDQRIIYRQHTGFDEQGDVERNQLPTVCIEGDRDRMATVGQRLSLSAVAGDDGIPAPQPAAGGPFRGSAQGLRVAWYVYRGDGTEATFEPRQFKVFPDFKRGSPWTRGWRPPPLPEDGRHPVQVMFDHPGRFVLRVLAHDGGATDSAEITVDVHAAP